MSIPISKHPVVLTTPRQLPARVAAPEDALAVFRLVARSERTDLQSIQNIPLVELIVISVRVKHRRITDASCSVCLRLSTKVTN